MSELTFVPVFTDAGRQAVAAAFNAGGGQTAQITHVAIGTGKWLSRDQAAPHSPTVAATSATALVTERVRVPVLYGGAVAGSVNEVVFNATIPGDADALDQFFFGEVGIFLSDGTMLAVAALDGEQGWGWRGANAWVLRFILKWDQLPSSSITVQFSGDAGQNAAFLAQQQLLGQVRQAALDAGLSWDPNDPSKLSQAIGLLGKPLDLVRRPTITSPADEATSIGETPTIQGDAYHSLYGIAHGATEIEVATDAAFGDVAWESGTLGAVTSAAVPGATLDTDTTYFARIRYGDAESVWSQWSPAISFATGATFTSVVQPTNQLPLSGATGVTMPPTLTASPFSMSGGVDTHQSTQWIVEEYIGPTSGDWLQVWDSGEVAGAASITPGMTFKATTTYRFKVRYKGAIYGWSDYSATTEFTTSIASGTFTDTTPGTRQFIVPANVSRIRVKLLGPGGSGGGYGGAGAGGGGGGGTQKTYDVVPGQTFSYTLGTPGQGVTSGNWGQSGSTSTFGAGLSATGGLGGQNGTSNAVGGSGGNGSGGDINGTGGSGGDGGVGAGAVRNGNPASLNGGGGGASGGYDGAQRSGGAGADIGGYGQSNGPSRGPAASDGGGGAGAGYWQSISGGGGNPKLVIEWGPGI